MIHWREAFVSSHTNLLGVALMVKLFVCEQTRGISKVMPSQNVQLWTAIACI